MAAFPTTSGAMPCMAKVPATSDEAECAVAKRSVGTFPLGGIVSKRPDGAGLEEMETEGCVASAGMILEGAVLDELDVVEAFFAGAGMDLEGTTGVEVGSKGVVLEGPLAAEVVEGRCTATIVVEVGNTFGEWRRS